MTGNGHAHIDRNGNITLRPLWKFLAWIIGVGLPASLIAFGVAMGRVMDTVERSEANSVRIEENTVAIQGTNNLVERQTDLLCSIARAVPGANPDPRICR